MGDVVDRGKFKFGLKCLTLLIEAKLRSGNVFILQSNHFTYHHIKFYPADFWLKLDSKAFANYTKMFDLLPYAVLSGNGLIACHGLPVQNLANGNNIKIGSSDWRTLIWSRLSDPLATPAYMKSVLKSNKRSVVIRSHDHYSRTKTHNNTVLTFTTSKNLPDTKRLVVEVDLKKEIKSINDVKLIDIDGAGC